MTDVVFPRRYGWTSLWIISTQLVFNLSGPKSQTSCTYTLAVWQYFCEEVLRGCLTGDTRPIILSAELICDGGKNLLRPPQVARRQSTLTTLREAELCRKWRLPQRRGSPLSARCFRPRSRQKGDRNRDLRLIWVNYWGTKRSGGKRERYKSLPWREMSVLWDRSSQ